MLLQNEEHATCCWYSEMKEATIGRTCSLDVVDQECLQNLWWEISWITDTWEFEKEMGKLH